ncbi:MAG TPA: DUF1579 family protein [Planctomycetota bacterium]|nr:DUF1579 family protein [Planctomycetota bacterium]
MKRSTARRIRPDLGRALGPVLVAAAGFLLVSGAGGSEPADGPRESLGILSPLAGEWARESRVVLPDGRGFTESGGARHDFILGARHLRMEFLAENGAPSALLLLSHDDKLERWLLTWLDDHADVPSVSTGAWDAERRELVLLGRERFPWSAAELPTRTTLRPAAGSGPALVVEVQDPEAAWRTILEVTLRPAKGG